MHNVSLVAKQVFKSSNQSNQTNYIKTIITKNLTSFKEPNTSITSWLDYNTCYKSSTFFLTYSNNLFLLF